MDVPVSFGLFLLVVFLSNPVVWSLPQQTTFVRHHDDDAAITSSSNNNIVAIQDHKLALQVVSPEIIRVFRCAKCSNVSQTMQDRQSLVVLPQQQPIDRSQQQVVEYQVRVSNNHKDPSNKKTTTTTITTDRLVITVSEEGTIIFTDRSNNRLLLQEHQTVFDIDPDTQAARVSQEWDLTRETKEAIYGGGQFVNGLLNYRSAPMHWKQFNTEAVVPFLISSNHYGVLWDLYGESLMNPPQEQIALTWTTTTTTEGQATGEFIPPTDGDYWLFVVACHGKFGCGGGITLILKNPNTPEEWNCDYNLANTPHSLPCRVQGLKQGQTYQVVLDGRAPADNATLWYTSIDTHNKLVLQTQASDIMDYYLVANGINGAIPPTLDGVIQNYRRLTGPAYLYSKWVYGFWQCKEHYHNQTELLASATKFRQEKIPVDAFVQDWMYWGDLGWGPQWDPKIYPDPAAMVQELHAAKIHFMVSDWSSFDPKTRFFKNLSQAGALIPDSNYMDPWNPAAGKLYMEFAQEAHFSIGVDALWLDATEPENCPQLGKQIFLGSGDEYANTYSLMVARLIHDGLVAKEPTRRVFSLTRSSFAGQQRYGGTLWSGDTSSSWDSLRRQVSMSINYQLSGIPYWSMDTGGFYRPSDQYTSHDYHCLLTRWFQFSVFTPIFRVHGSQSNTELWSYGPVVQHMIHDSAIRFRYRLLEYIYSGFQLVEKEGMTMQRGLVLDFWDDLAVADIADQFMFGNAFLVAPIYTPDSTRSVYLPKLKAGKWRCFFSGQEVDSGSTVQFTNMTMSHIPLFVRSSILVLGPDGREHVDDLKGSDPHKLEVRIYDGADSTFTLFEDDGTSADPSRPMTNIAFSWEEASRNLKIGDRTGAAFPGMAEQRTIDIVVVRPGVGVGIAPTGQPDATLTYDGSSVSINLGPLILAELA
jgi:alpha-D-xyloside xylohydrolase